MTREEVRVGMDVMCNGYEFTVTAIHTGQLEGMADVEKIPGGDRDGICVSLSELSPVPPKPPARARRRRAT
mgnify:CR=1 FL=1